MSRGRFVGLGCVCIATFAIAASAAAQPRGDVTDCERTAAGRPKLDGIWQAFVTANWDVRPHAAAAAPIAALGASGAVPPGLGVVEGGEIPYLEAALERQRANYEQRLALDPEVKCFMPGVPRATYMPHPFQIFQADDVVMIAYQYANAVRTVHMQDPGPAPTSFWMGWSRGHWEGDTLVVEVTNQEADTWLDRAGNFHGEELRVVERYTPMGPNHLQYEATLEDPLVYSRPWKMSFPLYRRVEPNAQLLEFKCVPFAEEVLYGHLRKRTDEDSNTDEGSDTE
jgi:hypothetical protein